MKFRQPHSDYSNMSEDGRNPETALCALEKIAEEIPSGISSDDVGAIIKQVASNPNETRGSICDNISLLVKKDLNTFWTDWNVDNKLRNLTKLPQRKGSNKLRPCTSPETKAKLIKAKVMQRYKTRVKKRLKKIEDKSMALRTDITKMVFKLHQQMEEFKKW